MTRLISILLLCFFASCLSYHYTDEGGVRVDNPKVFKYNKAKYRIRDKSLIDTNAIYLIDTVYDPFSKDTVQTNLNNQFCRFFSTGQVVFISCDGIPSADLINNSKKGIQGYFFIKDKQIRIDMFQDLNGGQTGKYFGVIQDGGNILFYEQRPETYFGSYHFLKKEKRKSIWRKVKVDGIKYYKPDW